MKLYKLTTQNNETCNHTKWGENVTHKIKQPVKSPKMCCNQVLHAYTNLNLALLLNPIHADIKKPKLWEAEGDVVVASWDKVGCLNLTTIKEIQYPSWWNKKMQVQIMFAILCAESVLNIFEKYNPTDKRPRLAIKAAKQCLNKDAARAARAADAANNAVYAAAAARAADAANNAVYAAAAARAADAAADAAYAAYAATDTDIYAAKDAARAARAAYDAANAAYDANNAAYADVNFEELADKAVSIIMNKVDIVI